MALRKAQRSAGPRVASPALVAGGCGSSSDDEPAQRAVHRARHDDHDDGDSGGDAGADGHDAALGVRASPRRTATTDDHDDDPAPKSRVRNPPTKATAQTTTAPPTRSPRRRAKLGKPQTFSGDGDRVIGRLALEAQRRRALDGDRRRRVQRSVMPAAG